MGGGAGAVEANGQVESAPPICHVAPLVVHMDQSALMLTMDQLHVLKDINCKHILV